MTSSVSFLCNPSQPFVLAYGLSFKNVVKTHIPSLVKKTKVQATQVCPPQKAAWKRVLWRGDISHFWTHLVTDRWVLSR